MRRLLNIIFVVAGIIASVVVSPPKTAAVGVATGDFHNVAVVYGLHVALPDDMRNFPAALVPLP